MSRHHRALAMKGKQASQRYVLAVEKTNSLKGKDCSLVCTAMGPPRCGFQAQAFLPVNFQQTSLNRRSQRCTGLYASTTRSNKGISSGQNIVKTQSTLLAKQSKYFRGYLSETAS